MATAKSEQALLDEKGRVAIIGGAAIAMTDAIKAMGAHVEDTHDTTALDSMSMAVESLAYLMEVAAQEG